MMGGPGGALRPAGLLGQATLGRSMLAIPVRSTQVMVRTVTKTMRMPPQTRQRTTVPGACR